MQDFSNVDFLKLTTEQMDALLDHDPSPASQQATSSNVTFESNTFGFLYDPSQPSDEPLGFGTTGFDPWQADFNDFHSAGLGFGQVREAAPFGADLPSGYMNGLDPSKNAIPQYDESLQTVDSETTLSNHSDFLTDLESSSGLTSAGSWQRFLEQDSMADSMVSIGFFATSEEPMSEPICRTIRITSRNRIRGQTASPPAAGLAGLLTALTCHDPLHQLMAIPPLRVNGPCFFFFRLTLAGRTFTRFHLHPGPGPTLIQLWDRTLL